MCRTITLLNSSFVYKSIIASANVDTNFTRRIFCSPIDETIFFSTNEYFSSW